MKVVEKLGFYNEGLAKKYLKINGVWEDHIHMVLLNENMENGTMHNFMIGQYGTFDEQKYRRDFKPGFYGVEACLFDNEEDVRSLVSVSINKGFKVGIHFPLRSGQAKLRDALFLSNDESIRLHALQLIEQELQFLVRISPEYVLFHYPKPVILDDDVNWELWRFSDRSEYVYESEYYLDEFKRQSEQLFQWLTFQAGKYNFIPVLEFDGLNKYVYQETFLEELLHKYPKIKLCLDTGRLHLQDCIDPNFDSKHVIRKFGKFAHTLHLGTCK